MTVLYNLVLVACHLDHIVAIVRNTGGSAELGCLRCVVVHFSRVRDFSGSAGSGSLRSLVASKD